MLYVCLSGTFRVKSGLAQMAKGGVVMDVTNVEQAIIAEQAGVSNIPHSNHVTSSKWVDTLIYHTTMCRNSTNLLYNPGHMTIWCLEVVLVVYARVVIFYAIMCKLSIFYE